MAVFSAWTARRAAGPGFIAGCVATVLWPAYSLYQAPMFVPFVIALALTSFCGLSILVLTVIDFRNNRRGRRLRPIRAFDVIFGLMLAIPSTVELSALLR